MKKAILVNDYASVEELNKLFEQGYTVESVDDRGVYILTKEDNIKKSINTELSTNITLDTKKAQRAFDLLGETVEQIKAGGFKPEPIRELSRDEINKINRKIIEKSLVTSSAKQPHVRIEFDDIRDVPKVWVDGELMDDDANDKSLVSLKVDWNTDTATENHKEFDINYYDLTSERPIRRGFHEGSVM
ncbi:hypothetical protein [Leuconostoc mesenteroides]|uniref:hypothetical protein n=1 Tax=Leuconostoc mesenteroides TaxID=1245 RepID=UPI002361A5E2|nr:hypothetical protein [Leuconostoc mesenteroides]